MLNLTTIIGARPQFIKSVSLSQTINQSYYSDIQETIIHTGQHFDYNMSDIFFTQLNISKPHYNLGISNLSHGKMTGKMMIKIEELLNEIPTDIMLVYGDTNSTLAAALVASKLNIPIAHVEAGIRNNDLLMPEEINRRLTDHISHYLFCPSSLYCQLLKQENIIGHIYNVGDIMYDTMLSFKHQAKSPKGIDLKNDYILATIHRQENTDNEQKLRNIITALQILSQHYKIILPLHPRTAKYVKQYDISLDKLTIIDPIGYLEVLYLLKNAQFIITDSGGMPKEAYYLQKSSVVILDNLIWQELYDYNIIFQAQADV